MTSTYALVAGGGTGGHIYPALAIADALVEKGHSKSSIRFMGSRRALEARVVPDAGYEIDLLSGRGIERSLSVKSLMAVIGLLAAAVKAVWICARRRPNVVVSVGGYAAAPAVVAAILLRIPLVLSETNAVPGAVNRLAGRFATFSAVAWPNTALPKAVLTGAPVRTELVGVDRSPEGKRLARQKLGLPEDRKVVSFVGGSLGAKSINTAAHDLAQRWKHRNDLALHHVVGRRDWPKSELRASSDSELFVNAVEYESDMASVYAASDVVICRSGAITTAEVAAAGVPAIFVPLPYAPGDHQTANAKALVGVDGAILIKDADCDGEHLALQLGPLLTDDSRLTTMGAQAASLGHTGAAGRTADLVEKAAGSSVN